MTKKLMLKQLASMLASFKRKKKYYCEVEYLESSGTQYIDTGIPLSNENTVKAKIRIIYENNSFFYGARKSYMVDAFGLHKSYAPFGNDSGMSYVDLRADTDYIVEQSQNGIFINGELKKTYPVSTFTTPENCYLFYLRQEGGFYDSPAFARIYYFQVWDNGVLVRDFIPVLGWDGKGYMYDKVSGQLFGNAGTGDFVVGRQIHPVEYIEAKNSGGDIEYAIGNYRLTNTTDLEITFSASANDNNWVIGQPSWIGVHYRKDTSTSNLPRVGITNSSTSASQCYVDYTDDEKITLALKGTDVYANGVKVGSITRVSAPATQTKYGIFAYKDISQDLPNLRIKNARIYRLKIWDNDVLVQDLIPAIDENGIGGFFENVNRTFLFLKCWDRSF